MKLDYVVRGNVQEESSEIEKFVKSQEHLLNTDEFACVVVDSKLSGDSALEITLDMINKGFDAQNGYGPIVQAFTVVHGNVVEEFDGINPDFLCLLDD